MPVINRTADFADDMRVMAEAQLTGIVQHQARVFGMEAVMRYERAYTPRINDAGRGRFAADVARKMFGANRVNEDARPVMAAEDFSCMLNARAGPYLFPGQGDTAMCHHPASDFNDGIAPVGASFFARLIERALPLG